MPVSWPSAARWETILRLEQLAFLIGLLYFGAFLISPQTFMEETHAQDPMPAIGFATVLVGILVARRFQGGFEPRVLRLTASGAIRSRFDTPAAFSAWFRRIAVVSFLCIVVTMIPLALYGLYVAPSNPAGKFHLMLGTSVGAWLISTRFAHGVASGIAASALTGADSRFVLTPGHPDNSSGFGALGYYYFEQGLILLVPTAYMISWLLFINLNLAALDGPFALSISDNPWIPTVAQAVGAYMDCESARVIPQDCPPEDLVFRWRDHFLNLMLYNLLIFLFAWGIPSILLRRAMRKAYRTTIQPLEDPLERDLRAARTGLLRLSAPSLSHYEKADQMALELARLRATPTFPIPLATAVITYISNISAILGLVTLIN